MLKATDINVVGYCTGMLLTY